MDCPACGTANSRVLDTFKGVEDKRARECACGARWKTTETIDKGSIRVATNPNQSPPISTNGSRSRRVTPNPNGFPPPATDSGGGVGGGLPSGSDPAPLSDQDPDPPKQSDQGVDRAKQTRPDPFGAHFGGTGSAFAKVYAAYPNKVGRSTASTVFAELASAHTRGADGLAADVLAAFETGMLGRYPYLINGEGKWPALEKFLALRRWEDEPNAEEAAVTGAKGHDVRVGPGRAEDVKHTATGRQEI